MGLFNFFVQKKNGLNGVETLHPTMQKDMPAIPETVFVEKEMPKDEANTEKNNSTPVEMELAFCFSFLKKIMKLKGMTMR